MTCSTETAEFIYCDICFQSLSHPPLQTFELAHAFPVGFQGQKYEFDKVTARPQIMRGKITFCTFLRVSAWLMQELLSCSLFPEYKW